MATGFTNYQENASLDATFGSGTPATLYLAVSTTTPNKDGTGFTEPVGNGYARVAITNNTTNFPAATTVGGQGQIQIATVQTFPTATGDWGSCTYVGVFDAPTGGNLRWMAQMSVAKSPTSGDALQFAANTLTVTQV